MSVLNNALPINCIVPAIDSFLGPATVLPIECLLFALDAHMLSHHGYARGRGPRAPKRAWGPAAVGTPFLGPWLGPGPISVMAEHMGIKGRH